MTNRRSGRSILFTTVLLSFAALFPAVRALSQERIGSVLEINGAWFVESNSALNLQKSGAVRAGAVIRPRNPNDPRSFIVITDLNGKIIERRYCGSNGCQPISLPAQAEPPGILSRLYTAVWALWGGNPAKYKTHGSRGGPRALKEAVVQISEGAIDMSRVFEVMPAGTYRVRFVNVPCKTLPCKTALAPTSFVWTSGTSTKLPVPRLAIGLYEVQLMRPDAPDKPQTLGTEAWVLVAPPSMFEELSRSFDDAVSLTKQWDAEMKTLDQGGRTYRISGTTVSSFLRATLDHLARGMRKNA
jgi:hypothetical protein